MFNSEARRKGRVFAFSAGDLRHRISYPASTIAVGPDTWVGRVTDPLLDHIRRTGGVLPAVHDGGYDEEGWSVVSMNHGSDVYRVSLVFRQLSPDSREWDEGAKFELGNTN